MFLVAGRTWGIDGLVDRGWRALRLVREARECPISESSRSTVVLLAMFLLLDVGQVLPHGQPNQGTTRGRHLQNTTPVERGAPGGSRTLCLSSGERLEALKH